MIYLVCCGASPVHVRYVTFEAPELFPIVSAALTDRIARSWRMRGDIGNASGRDRLLQQSGELPRVGIVKVGVRCSGLPKAGAGVIPLKLRRCTEVSPASDGGAFLVLGSPQSPDQRDRVPEGFGDSPGVRLVYRLELLEELRALFLTTGKPRPEGRYLRLEGRYLRLERCYLGLERSNLGAQVLVLGFGLSNFYRCIDERFNERLVCRAKA
jgi:hypothetical protein